MARNSRHSKILEIISENEIETQEELVASLRKAKFDVTQATISRDIKELGLIKILSENKKYKYSTVNSSVQSFSIKAVALLKDCVISIKTAANLNVIKVMKGTGNFVASLIDQLAIIEVLGCTYGDDTVLVVSADNEDSFYVKDKISQYLV